MSDKLLDEVIAKIEADFIEYSNGSKSKEEAQGMQRFVLRELITAENESAKQMCAQLTTELEKLKRIVEVYEKANALYADPENRKEEWVADTSYYDPNPPFRRTVLQHGKAARQAKEEVERIRSEG